MIDFKNLKKKGTRVIWPEFCGYGSIALDHPNVGIINREGDQVFKGNFTDFEANLSYILKLELQPRSHRIVDVDLQGNTPDLFLKDGYHCFDARLKMGSDLSGSDFWDTIKSDNIGDIVKTKKRHLVLAWREGGSIGCLPITQQDIGIVGPDNTFLIGHVNGIDYFSDNFAYMVDFSNDNRDFNMVTGKKIPTQPIGLPIVGFLLPEGYRAFDTSYQPAQGRVQMG